MLKNRKNFNFSFHNSIKIILNLILIDLTNAQETKPDKINIMIPIEAA